MAGFDRFGKLFSSTGERLPPSDAQANSGLQYLGDVHPSKELFNAFFWDWDWKDNWLFNNIKAVTDLVGLTLTDSVTNRLLTAIKSIAAMNITGIGESTVLSVAQAGLIRANATVSPAPVTMTLPSAASVIGLPVEFTFVRTDTMTTRHPIIAAAGSDTIEGAATMRLYPGTRLTLRSSLDGVWRVVSRFRDGASPVGTIQMWLGDTLPARHIALNGQLLNRIDYAELFEAWGTKYGAGDGSTTFGTPDMRGRAAVCSDSLFGGPAANVLAGLAAGGSQGTATVQLTAAQNGLHNHAVTVSTTGAHAHNGVTVAAGSHNHAAICGDVSAGTPTGTTTVNGSHIHSGVTAAAGVHNHVQGSESLYNNYGGGSAVGPRSWNNVGPQQAYAGQNTGDSGNHQHGLVIDASGDHSHGLNMNNMAVHAHAITVAATAAHTHPINSDGDHTHTVTLADSGTGAAHTNVQPSFGLAFIVYTGV